MEGAPEAAERVKRSIARHTRAAFDEGALPMDEPCAAALVLVLAIGDDQDASPAEAFGPPPTAGWAAEEGAVARACSLFEPRLGPGGADPRAIVFEACARLATRAAAGPWPAERLRDALVALAASELRATLRRSNAALFPIAFDGEIGAADRHMALLERTELDALVAKDPRELASAIAR
jgi:hypothetical protein